jgi:acetyl-CoA acetyltransferase
MREVAIIGVHMTKFGKHIDRSLRDLGQEAVMGAVKDAAISLKDIQVAYVGNGLAGLLTGQEGIRGQVILKEVGLQELPIINVEGACASGSLAVFQAWMAVASGYCDTALALGVEKMHVGDTATTTAALSTDSDIDMEGRLGFSFPSYYAMRIKRHMDQYGTTREQIARVTIKNHKNGCLNPYAQYQKEVTLEEVLNSRVIAWPLTLLMCCPIGDGAAAAILTSKKIARRHTTQPVTIASLAVKSGRIFNPNDPNWVDICELTANQAYEEAGIGPGDVGAVELHAAACSGELIRMEHLGLCKKGESGRSVDDGETEITGRIPVNPSGGMDAKGHPVGATGVGQLTEIVWQLRGQAGARQINPKPKVGLVHNGGGMVAGEPAVQTVTVLKG